MKPSRIDGGAVAGVAGGIVAAAAFAWLAPPVRHTAESAEIRRAA